MADNPTWVTPQVVAQIGVLSPSSAASERAFKLLKMFSKFRLSSLHDQIEAGVMLRHNDTHRVAHRRLLRLIRRVIEEKQREVQNTVSSK